MTNEDNLRIIFRPTKHMNEGINKVVNTGRFATKSEFVRYAIRKALDNMEVKWE